MIQESRIQSKEFQGNSISRKMVPKVKETIEVFEIHRNQLVIRELGKIQPKMSTQSMDSIIINHITSQTTNDKARELSLTSIFNLKSKDYIAFT